MGPQCGNSSVGRARPCQGRGREFEPRFPLYTEKVCPGGGMVDALVSGASVERRASSSLVLGTKEIEEYEFAVMQFMLFFVLMYLLPAVPSFCHSDKLYFQWAWDCCISGQVVECLEIRKSQTLCLCVFV